MVGNNRCHKIGGVQISKLHTHDRGSAAEVKLVCLGCDGISGMPFRGPQDTLEAGTGTISSKWPEIQA